MLAIVQEEICGYEVWYSLLPQYTQGSADTLYEDVEHQLKDSFGPHDKPRIAACVYSRKKGSGRYVRWPQAYICDAQSGAWTPSSINLALPAYLGCSWHHSTAA